MIVDAWMQHPTPHFLVRPMFASLRRWLGQVLDPETRRLFLAETAAAVFRLPLERA